MTKNNLPIWRVDNLIPFILIIGSFFVYLVRLSIVETKIDNIIKNQTELSAEFRQWKTQAEIRLGTVESNQNTVISYVENHLQVKIR